MFYVLSMPDLLLQEMVYILDAAEELKGMTLSSDYGKHLLGVEDLLQKHSLVEADINVLGDRVKTVATVSIEKHVRSKIPNSPDTFGLLDQGCFSKRQSTLVLFSELSTFSHPGENRRGRRVLAVRPFDRGGACPGPGGLLRRPGHQVRGEEDPP